jgi:putative ABC transport system permease protein
LFNKQRRERDFAEELESHLQMHIEDNLRAGMTAEEARRDALIKLGGVEQTKENYRDRRGLPGLETLVQDVRYALRALARSPGLVAVGGAALALGIGANTAIFSVVNSVLLHPLPYKDPAHLVSIEYFLPQRGMNGVVDADYFAWRRQNHSFQDMAAYGPGYESTLTGAGEAERLHRAKVTASFFHVLGVEPRLGRSFRPEEDRPGGTHVAVLCDALWRRRFAADPAAVGRTITLDGNPYTIVGVLPPDFEFPGNSRVELIVPYALAGQAIQVEQTIMFIQVVARLRPGISATAAAADLDAITQRLQASYPAGLARMMAGARAQAIPLHDRLVGNTRPALLMLLGAVGFVLLIACANVANLQLARAVAREREMAVRAALGAGRWRLARQLFTESFLLAMAGAAPGLLLAGWVVSLLRSLGPRDTPYLASAHVDLRVLLFTFAVSLLSGLLLGLAPILAGFRLSLNDSLSQSGGRSGAGARTRRPQKALAVLEVALSLVLLVGAGLSIRSFLRLVSVAPGFDPHGVLTAQVSLPSKLYQTDDQQRAFFAQLLERVRGLPGVVSAGAAAELPLQGFTMSAPVTVEGHARAAPEAADAFLEIVTPGYFSALHIPLVAGRLLDARDTAGSPLVLVVNRAFARVFFPNENPLGRRLKMTSDEWRIIVGVVADMKQAGLAAGVAPEAFFSLEQWATPDMALVIRSSRDPLSLVSAVRKQAAELDRNLPLYSIATMDELLSADVASQRFDASLLGAFAGLAVLLAAVGIYGVMAYAVGQRTHEIGVRMALGAEPAGVLGMVLAQGLRMALTGVVVGLVGSFALTRFMRSLLFEVSPTDPATFAGVSLALVVVALGASYIPARRATRIDPMAALRYE